MSRALALKPPVVSMRRPQRLTMEDAREIRAKYSRGEKPAAMARAYGVTRNAVWHILNGRTWREEQGGS